MNAFVQTINIALPVLYGTICLLYAQQFLGKNDRMRHLGPVLLAVTTLLHLTYLVVLGKFLGRHPMGTIFEFMSFVAISLGAMYLFIENWHKNRHAGTFIIPFIFVLQMVASIGSDRSADLRPMLEDVNFGLHTSLFSVAYSAFFLSMVYAIMLLLFFRSLKKKQYGLVFERLPSLNLLSSMTNRTAVVGFICMTAGIAFGIQNASGTLTDYHLDPKIVFTLITWALYAFMIFTHYVLRWTERRSAIISIVAFCSVLLLTIASHSFVSSWHQFTGPQ